MCKYIITKNEIIIAEKDIFDNGDSFNEEQVAFIKYLDTCCVQAYAGTGKTRALVGKLHILAQKEVWNDGRGICIISHTNVAVDEIKKHVAIHYPAVMKYPNFIGTIHEFVNKFLFIPYLASKGLKIKFQDESRYLDYKKEGSITLNTRIRDHEKSRLNHGAKDARKTFFNKLNSVHISGNKINAKNPDGSVVEFTDLTTKCFTQQTAFSELQTIIQKEYENGRFLFIESFICGFEYLNTNQILKNIISNRFKFVFLDEAQDCSDLQLKILNELFPKGSNSVFQQIGDENQAISEQCWKPSGNILHFGISMRFGGGIEAAINLLRIDKGTGIKDNNLITTKKVLLTYNTNPEKLLDKFLEILKTESIPFNEDKGYFAISHEHNDLSNAFPYSKELAQRKTNKMFFKLENDNEYFEIITGESIKSFGSNLISKALFNLFYKYYKVDGSWSDLREKLRNTELSDSFKKLILEISFDVLANYRITNIDSIITFSKKILGDDYLNLRVNVKDIGGADKTDTILNNLYPPPPSKEEPKIRIGTIHSVKGQTHNATLLLSARLWGKQDIGHALGNTVVRTPQFKRNLYVAFSRAKDLFAFAINKSVYSGITDKSIFKDFKELEI